MTIKDKSPKQVLEDEIRLSKEEWAEWYPDCPEQVGDHYGVTIPYWAAVAILSALDRP